MASKLLIFHVAEDVFDALVEQEFVSPGPGVDEGSSVHIELCVVDAAGNDINLIGVATSKGTDFVMPEVKTFEDYPSLLAHEDEEDDGDEPSGTPVDEEE